MPIRRRFAAQSGQILTMSALWAALCGLAACGTTGPAAASSPAASNAPQSESPTPASVPQQQMTALTAATGAVNPVGAGLAAAVPAPGQTVRVGGDLKAAARQQGDDWLFGRCSITTPLPEGYPAPTPPGAIDLKTYPSIRRAEFSATNANPDIGMNVGFFPLFNHIKRRDIAMTSPVEMDYAGMAPVAAAKQSAASASMPPSWTMSFVYRTPELGPVGDDAKDSRVKVVDTKPQTFVSVGMQGFYGIDNVRRGIAKLNEWLAANPQWEAVGDPRSLYYNGPERANRDKWLEVQLPVRQRNASSDGAPK